MTDLKQDLIDALNETPLAPYLDRMVTGVELPAYPSDALSAQIACGVFAYNMSLYLKAWEGIPLLYVALYTGNNVNALQGVFMASIKAQKPPTPSEFEPLSPSEGGAYSDGATLNFSLQIINGKVINCLLSLDGAQETPLQYQQNGVWGRELLVTGIGDHNAGFYVLFEGGDGGFLKEKTVNFTLDNR